MRQITVCLVVLTVALFAAGPSAASAAERVEQTLGENERLATAGHLRVENLLGSITIEGAGSREKPSAVARVVVEAETREEADRLAESIRLDRGSDKEGSFVRVAYPLDAYPAFRPPRAEKAGPISRWIRPLFQREVQAVTYRGRDVRIGPEKGAASVAVHLTLRLPHGVRVSARQVAGTIRCQRLRGDVSLDAGPGDIFGTQVYGTLHATTEAGDLVLKSFKGENLELRSGSGRIELVDADARRAKLTTASGRIEGRLFNSTALAVESEAGDVAFEEFEALKLDVKAGTGQVSLASRLRRTREVSVESGKGDVTVRMSALAPFVLSASTKSGSVTTRGLKGIEVVEEGPEGSRLKRSTGGASLKISAPEGKVTLLAL